VTDVGVEPWLASGEDTHPIGPTLRSCTRPGPSGSRTGLEYRHGSIRRNAGRADEQDTGGGHSVVVPPEIVSAQEQEDAPTRLVADELGLVGRRGACEQQRRVAGARRRHYHPALVLLRLVRVLDQGEAKRLGV
jgi:hypothetical protein